MTNQTIVGLLLVCCAWGADAYAAQLATTCDRECLRGKVTQLLHALVKHDVSGLSVADTLRVTEDAVEKPLAKVGLVGTVTRLRGFRQDIVDERARPERLSGRDAAIKAALHYPEGLNTAKTFAAVNAPFAPNCAWPGACASAAAIS